MEPWHFSKLLMVSVSNSCKKAEPLIKSSLGNQWRIMAPGDTFLSSSTDDEISVKVVDRTIGLSIEGVQKNNVPIYALTKESNALRTQKKS